MYTHAININERTFDLIVFLNDGVPPSPDKDDHYLLCRFDGPREITSKIVSKDEFYNAQGLEKINLMI